jgi:hypothetical protein
MSHFTAAVAQESFPVAAGIRTHKLLWGSEWGNFFKKKEFC